MALNKFKEAISALKNAIAISPDQLSKVRAQWYLALAYLKKDDLEKSKKLLEDISNNKLSPAYKIKARGLLDKLK